MHMRFMISWGLKNELIYLQKRYKKYDFNIGTDKS
jgi:hypothetical protein